MDELAADAAERGWAAWNVEYRRIGAGGGWPETAIDVAAAVDHVAVLARKASLDVTRVALVGHSAGGHLALLAAGRRGTADDAPLPPAVVRPIGVVAQAAVSDLYEAARLGLSRDAAVELLGGAPERRPRASTRRASPADRLPLGVPLLVVHGDADPACPWSSGRNFVARADAAGETIEAVELAGTRAHGAHRPRLARLGVRPPSGSPRWIAHPRTTPGRRRDDAGDGRQPRPRADVRQLPASIDELLQLPDAALRRPGARRDAVHRHPPGLRALVQAAHPRGSRACSGRWRPATPPARCTCPGACSRSSRPSSRRSTCWRR